MSLFSSDYSEQYPQRPITYTAKSGSYKIQVVAVIQGHYYLVMRCAVTLNSHGAADSAEITVPLKGTADFSEAFDGIAVVPVQLYVGIYQSQTPPANLSIAGKTLIFSGMLDVNTWTFDADDYSIQIHCRSLAAPLIDNRVTSLAANMYTTTFVTNIAQQYGLTAVILPAPGTPGYQQFTVADVYKNNFSVGVQNARIWDTLLQFAQVDDRDVWVTGSKLYYCVPNLIQRTTFPFQYGTGIKRLVVSHSVNSEDFRVELRTYEPKIKTASIQRIETDADGNVTTVTHSKIVTSNPSFDGTKTVNSQSVSPDGTVNNSQTTTTGGVKNASASGSEPTYNGPLIYKFFEGGMNQAVANALAASIHRRISMQLYSISLRIPLTPVTLGLGITSLLRISGVPIAKANDDFWPKSMNLSIDKDSGAYWDIDAVNIALPAGEA